MPYTKASLAGASTVSPGRRHSGCAFLANGRYRPVRKGEAVNQIVEGAHRVKREIAIRLPSGKPRHPLLWPIELESNLQSPILFQPNGAFEVFYRDKADHRAPNETPRSAPGAAVNGAARSIAPKARPAAGGRNVK
ncbi:hypothetical protein [Paludibaculum fermentans]|uniref:Uncharacterized protein n=1 Tax=Paludibaculum fermentans TaxID=1473598 RepID=A0A7S7SMV2_PALFE|nr:hypothetical protein [Paludibaculum fermentans]QOY90323.1 hypothetical protein IRI77_10315 [Paludibaculum fermentans]